MERYAATYYPSDAEYARRKLLRLRHSQVQKRTATLAELRGLLNAYLLRPPGSQLWTKKAMSWLRKQRLPEARGNTIQLLTEANSELVRALEDPQSEVFLR